MKARQVNGEMEQLPDKEQSPDSASTSKHSSLIKPDSILSNNMTPPPGVRLHHRAVSSLYAVCYIVCSSFVSFFLCYNIAVDTCLSSD